MTTTNTPGAYVTACPSQDSTPTTEAVTSLFAAADLPVGTVRFAEAHGPLDVTGTLEETLSLHWTQYVAAAFSRYKSAWHWVATEGGVDGAPVPSTVPTALNQLDEDVVALASDAWHAGFQVAMAIAPALAQGGVAARLPETTVCPQCHGYQVITDRWRGRHEMVSETGDAICPMCDGEGVVSVTPDLLVLGDAASVLPLPVRVVRT